MKKTCSLRDILDAERVVLSALTDPKHLFGDQIDINNMRGEIGP